MAQWKAEGFRRSTGTSWRQAPIPEAIRSVLRPPYSPVVEADLELGTLSGSVFEYFHLVDEFRDYPAEFRAIDYAILS